MCIWLFSEEQCVYSFIAAQLGMLRKARCFENRKCLSGSSVRTRCVHTQWVSVWPTGTSGTKRRTGALRYIASARGGKSSKLSSIGVEDSVFV